MHLKKCQRLKKPPPSDACLNLTSNFCCQKKRRKKKVFEAKFYSNEKYKYTSIPFALNSISRHFQSRVYIFQQPFLKARLLLYKITTFDVTSLLHSLAGFKKFRRPSQVGFSLFKRFFCSSQVKIFLMEKVYSSIFIDLIYLCLLY